MMRETGLVCSLVPTVVLLGAASLPEVVWGGELRLLDKPLWIFPGQTFRVAIQQPQGSGKLGVTAPPAVELFDAWPKDSIQRFYFRALEPGDATLAFKGRAGGLRVPLEVIPWSAVYEPRRFKKLALPRIWPLGALGLEKDYSLLKKRRTFYSIDDLRAMRRSKAEVPPRAREWLAMSDEDIWNIIPGPCVPRTCLIVLSGRNREDGRGKGCPVCGMKVYEGRSGFYPWIFDPKGHPWKVGCPSCGSWFPSNDWHEGDMHSGDFPDDGFGCEPVKAIRSPSGTPWRWPFIAYYHQWTAYMRTFTPGIEQCARAFALTGDRRYAHKAAIGLFRFAESMLDMSLNVNHRKMAVRDAILRWPVGAPAPRDRLNGTFLYIQPNWDTSRMEKCARAWDLIFDQIARDRPLIAFCRRRHHPEIRTAEDFRRFVEAGVIRVPLQACLDDAVARNFPMQEVLVATLALVMDSPRCLDLADWLLNEGAGLRFTLSNDFFKDGAAFESEGYNNIHIRDMERIFDLLERIRALYPDEYRKRGLVSPYGDSKYRRMYDFPLENSLIGRTTTWTGDTGHALSAAPMKPMQGFPIRPGQFLRVYERTRDPRFAQALAGPGGKIPPALRDPKLRAEAGRALKTRGWQVKLGSGILDGYGHVILRSGAGEHQRAFWLRYGRVKQHRHEDLLTMGLAALKRDMLPELGYPQGWTYHRQWAANWGTHYGTHITGVGSGSFGRGRLTLFSDTPPARVASATATLLSGTQEALRSRTIALIDLSERDCYAVTLERVLGGKEHHLSFHGPDGSASPVGLELKAQPGGTVLGPAARYGDVSAVPGGDRELACLAFMYDVRRAEPRGVWGLDYHLLKEQKKQKKQKKQKEQKDGHLRMTMVAPEGGSLALARGKPPQGKKSYEMTWAILRRKGAAPLASQFLTVLEPYEGARSIRKIERVRLSGGAGGAFKPLGVRITSRDFVDTIIFQPENAAPCATADGIRCDAEFGFWRERGGRLVGAVLAGGTALRRKAEEIASPSAAYRGQVKRCDWRKRTLLVTPRPKRIAALAGKHIQIGNASGSHASYLIESAEPVGDGCRVTLALDPRIGEGFVRTCEDGRIVSATKLRFWNYWRYYAGKIIANEDASQAYRLSDVADAVNCTLDPAVHGTVAARRLRADFADKDGDGRPRFVIYDYGPGDQVTIKSAAATPSRRPR